MKSASRRPRAAPEAAAPKPPASAPASRFIIDGPRDLGLMVLAPLWITPLLFVLGAAVTDRTVNLGVMALGAVGHHLPGMLRAYGDHALFRRFRNRFLVAPPLLVLACVTASVQGFAGMQLIAFGWGVWHGMMQSYGFARIYAAKASATSRRAARLDFALLASWFSAAILCSPLRMHTLVDLAVACGAPIPTPGVLDGLRVASALSAACATIFWVVGASLDLRAGVRPGLLRVVVLATSVAFFWFANVRVQHLLLATPLFELFHDVQYFTIVWAFNRRRDELARRDLAPWLRALSQPRATSVLLYAGAILAYGALALWQPADRMGEVLVGILTASQLLHFYYDGFIWKVREAETAAPLGVRGASAPPRLRRVNTLGWTAFAAGLFLLAATERALGRTPRERLLPVADLFPQNPIIQWRAAETRWARGEKDAALDGFRRALGADPGYGPARKNLAISLGQLADEAEARGDRALSRRYVEELSSLREGLEPDLRAWADEQVARYGR